MISIIVPIFNSESTLDRCIKSIINQTYRNLELILVDDGSTDKSGSICDYYEKIDNRIKVIHNRNNGVSNARNSGLEQARGGYIQFVDSDDFINENTCQILLDNIKTAKTDMVIFGVETVYKDKTSYINPPDEALLDFRNSYMKFTYFYSNGLINPIWNKLYKKDKISSKFSESISLGEDLIFNLDYLMGINSISCISYPLYCYMDDNIDSLTKINRSDIIEIALLCNEKIREFCLNRFNEKVDLSILDQDFIRDIFNAVQRVIIDNDLNKKKKLEYMKLIVNNDRIQEALFNIKHKNIQLILFSIFVRFRCRYFLYYFFMNKKIIQKYIS